MGNKTSCYTDDVGRECNGCGNFKPWAEFHRSKNGINNRTARCKVCLNEDTRLRAAAQRGPKKPLKRDMQEPVCRVEGCGRDSFYESLCLTHYNYQHNNAKKDKPLKPLKTRLPPTNVEPGDEWKYCRHCQSWKRLESGWYFNKKRKRYAHWCNRCQRMNNLKNTALKRGLPEDALYHLNKVQ